MITAKNISFGYDRPLLSDISFTVNPGELLIIIGPNGAGKSTLLQLINGTLKPQAGSISLNGREIAQYARRELARQLGYVPQESVIRFPLTVTEFVLQGRFAHINGLGFESDRDLAAGHEAMRLTDTFEFASRRINELSGGERQRVLLARALAQEPRVLLLDELTANLDISYQVGMLELVKNLTRTRGLVVVVVTHELNLAAEFADAVMLLQAGHVLALGAPGEVLTEERLRLLFATRLMVDQNPLSGAPRITFSTR